MNCTRAVELTHAYLDRQIDAGEALELGRHLATCAGCESRFTRLQTLCAEAAVLVAFEDEGDIAARVIACALGPRMPTQLPRENGWGSRRPLIASVAVGVLVACGCLGWILMKDRPEGGKGSNLEEPDRAPGSRGPIPPPAVEGPGSARPAGGCSPEVQVADDFDARAVVNRLFASVPVSEEARQREQDRERLIQDLVDPQKRAEAVNGLIAMADTDKSGRAAGCLAVAAARRDMGPEVFGAVAGVEPRICFAPVYIAALGLGKTRQEALALLRKISGRRFGPQAEVWNYWWICASRQVSVVAGG